MKESMGDLFCLSNFIDYSLVIHQPLKHSNRIKYTCFDISNNFIIFGATSGSLYLFNRQGKFLHLIPNKHGTITHLAISSNEKYVAFSTQRSIICVYAVNLSPQTVPQVIVTHLSSEQNVQVTCIQWTQDEKQFYYGDSKGQVNLVLLSSFIGHSLLNMTVHPILFLDSPIVQIDDFESLLLVSNNAKCILCNTEYEEYKQIGNRPRDGLYGACFFISQNENIQPSRIYCARPGTRLWEVDFEGEVLQTHQFKAALAIPPSKIQRPDDSFHQINQNNDEEANNLSDNDANSEVLNWQPQNLQFSKLQKLTQDFILAFTELGLYIFDVTQSSVVLWCNQFERIVDCKVLNDDIIIFTQTGSLFSVQLTSLQGYACNLVYQDKLLDCASLMRHNLKYFADKAREDYNLNILNQIKNFLINRHEFELLNDLSVVFDAIAQCESNGSDNNSSSGASTGTAERSTSLGASGGGFHFNNRNQQNHQLQQQQNLNYFSKTSTTPSPTFPTVSQNQQQISNSSKGVYVLENSFCDNLKAQQQQSQQRSSSGEKHFKDALLTVTGKFGKNIIKYKFNIFAEDQQKLVRELIPANERSMPFKDIKAFYEHGENGSGDGDGLSDEEEIVCRNVTKRLSSNKSKITLPTAPHISAEEKTIYNLYLICKSAKFSNSNFVERYRPVFDEYSASELIRLLSKLENVMIEHGDEEIQAKRNCFEMYFHYLNSELIWEVDDNTRDYIKNGFMLLNNSEDIIRCENCSFPIKFDNSCQFHELGSILLRYYWSRNEQIQCFDVLNAVPALLDILAKLYISEQNLNKVLPIVMNYGQPELLMELGKSFNVNGWAKAFEQFVDLIQGRAICVNCECYTCLEQVNTHFFYSWNCFLNIALEYLTTEEILALLFKWSSYIPNDAVDREFFTRCLLQN